MFKCTIYTSTVGNRRIRKKLKPKRGRPGAVTSTPAEEKDEWALRALRLEDWNLVEGSDSERYTRQIKKVVRGWHRVSWDAIWAGYQSTFGNKTRSPAQLGDLWVDRLALHDKLRKAESSALTQMRTNKIGLANFLY